jgi:hypothetical protein
MDRASGSGAPFPRVERVLFPDTERPLRWVHLAASSPVNYVNRVYDIARRDISRPVIVDHSEWLNMFGTNGGGGAGEHLRGETA